MGSVVKDSWTNQREGVRLRIGDGGWWGRGDGRENWKQLCLNNGKKLKI